MTLIVIPGDSNSNSYVSLNESDLYFSVGYKKEKWIGITNSEKENLLIESTRLLDQHFTWSGFIPSSSTQSLRWPRSGVYDIDQRLIDKDVIPKQVKYAVCELAYSIYLGNGFNIEENTIDKLKIGPIVVDFSKTSKDPAFPKIVTDLLNILGFQNTVNSNAVKVVTLMRT